MNPSIASLLFVCFYVWRRVRCGMVWCSSNGKGLSLYGCIGMSGDVRCGAVRYYIGVVRYYIGCIGCGAVLY